MSATQALEALQPAASRVRDPISGDNVWQAKMIAEPRIDGDVLRFTLVTTEHSDADRDRIEAALRRNLEGSWSGRVEIKHRSLRPPRDAHSHAGHDHAGHSHAHAERKEDPVPGMSGPGPQPHGGPIQKQPIEGVRHIVAVASGKGGVGKSTVAVNLAVALKKKGLKVGLVDIDIYGPSLPLMLGVKGQPVADGDNKILPLQAYGIKVMSMGFLVPDKEAIIWRGPMVMGVVRQFLQDVAWAPLDVLVVDLPPGTGDAQLTMVQNVPLSGSVIVTTPQDVALLDAVRGIEMFRKLDVPVLGLIENMAWLDVPGSERMYPFGQGGGVRTAAQYGAPLLAQVPLDTRIREGGDRGIPATLNEDSEIGAPFRAAADALWNSLG